MTEPKYDSEQGTPDEQEQSASLGRILREARERRGLTREEAAQELRLHERVVAALEEDRHGSLPPAAFVVGYIRNYAKLLDLPAEDLVSMYGHPEPRTPHKVGNVRDRKGVDSGSLPMRLVTYTLIIGLIVLAVLWWMSQEQGMDGGAGAFFEQSGVTPESSVPSMPAPDRNSEMAAAMPEDEPVAVADEVVTPPAEPTPADAPAPAAPQDADSHVAAVPEEAVEAEPVEAQTVAEPPAEQGLPVEATVAAVASEAAEQAGGPAGEIRQPELTLKFERDCWTEVKDAAGKRLVYDLVKAGRSRTVQGQAPFRIFLGYAPGVDVTYNGKPFDHTPFQERHIARFTVGEATDNPPR